MRSFERWKKKYTRRTKRLRLQRKERRRPEWQVEREGIARLVQRYPEVRRGRDGAAGLGGVRAGGPGGPAGAGKRLLCWGGVCVCERGAVGRRRRRRRAGRGPGQGSGGAPVGRAVPLVVGGACR